MTNRRRVLKYGASVGAVGLAGCIWDGGDNGGGSTGSGDVLVLTDSNDSNFREHFNRISNEFTKETGIRVSFEYSGIGVGLEDRLTTLIQAGSPPTMIESPANQEAGDLYTQGMLEPITEVVADLESRYNELPDERRFRPRGEDLIAPTYMFTWLETYNTDKYGAPSDIDTYDKLEAAAPEVDSEEMRAVTIPAGPTGHSNFQMFTMAACYEGADMARITGDTPAQAEFKLRDSKDKWVEILEFNKRLHEFSAENANQSFGGSIGEFGNKQSAWLLMSGSGPRVVAQNDPDYAKESVGLKPIVAPSGNRRSTAFYFTNGWAMLNSDAIGTKTAENGKEFLRYMMRDEFLNERYELEPVTRIPAYSSISNSSDFLNLEPYQNNDALRDFADHIINEIVPGAELGNSIGLPDPYYGPMSATNSLGAMMNETLIQDVDPSQAFDNHVGDLEEAFDSVQNSLES